MATETSAFKTGVLSQCFMKHECAREKKKNLCILGIFESTIDMFLDRKEETKTGGRLGFCVDWTLWIYMFGKCQFFRTAALVT